MSSQKYTQEHVDFLASNIEGCRFAKLTKAFNQHFGLDVSAKAVRALAYRQGLHRDMDPTKNWKVFKSGNKPCNYKPVGAEHVNRDGYTFVKVADSRSARNWRAKHMLIWEAVHGPIPGGHVLVFADGDKSHIELNNLILVTKEQMARLNYKHLIQDDPDLTRSGVIVADIIIKCAERKRSSKLKNTKEDKVNEE